MTADRPARRHTFAAPAFSFGAMMTSLRLTAFFAAAFALSALAASPADAQSRRELAARLAAAETRLQQLEQRVLTGDPAAVMIQSRLDELERRQLELNGQIEELENENRRLREEVGFLRRGESFSDSGSGGEAGGSYGNYADGAVSSNPYDGPTRLGAGSDNPGDIDSTAERAIEEARRDGGAATGPRNPEEAAGASFGATRTVILPADPADALDVAKGLLIDGRFDEAQEAFAQFIARFSDSPLVGEAYYWEGETYSVRGDYARAANAYIESLTAAPEGERSADAMIGLAASLAAMGQSEDACGTLDAFDAQYPRADAALRRKADRARSAAGCPR